MARRSWAAGLRSCRHSPAGPEPRRQSSTLRSALASTPAAPAGGGGAPRPSVAGDGPARVRTRPPAAGSPAMRRGVAFAAGIALAIGIVLGAVVAAAGLLGGSGGGDDPRSGVDADTARFTYGDRSAEVDLIECAVDGETFVAAGRRGGGVLPG